jgi:hypothetical protein
MSYSIIDHEGMALIEGIYCISLVYIGFDEELLIDTVTGERYSLDMIKKFWTHWGSLMTFFLF